jgi:hypothetical protein
MTLDWTALGEALRESALDAHDGVLPPLQFAYSFLLDNPECFLHVMPMEVAMSAVFQADPEWPDDMPQEPNIELIAAYYRAGEAE